MKKILKRIALVIVVLLVLAMVLPYLIPVEQYTHEVAGQFENSAMVDFDGTMLHMREWLPEGNAKANILLVHGFCGSTYTWEQTAPALQDAGYRVLAIDIPPFGYSDRFPENGHGLAARNDYAWAAIDAATGDDEQDATWWLVGHSMGGGIIEAMAQLKPDRTAGLIFANGGGFGDRGGSGSLSRSLGRALVGFGPFQRWVEVIAKRFIFQEDYIRGLCESAAGEPPTEDILREYLAALRVPRTASAILNMFRDHGASVDLDPANITQPALVFWGSEDSWVPLSRGERLHESIPHSELHVIDGAHHMPMETHIEETNAAFLAFLDKHTTNPETEQEDSK